MPEIDILRNSSQKVLGALRGAFKGFGCPTATENSLMILIKSCRQSDVRKVVDGEILIRT